jgi:hypothetical protein
MANEELKGNQHKIDANKNGKVDAHDFKLLRAKKGKTVQEGIKGAGVGAALGSVAGGPVGAAIGGALGHVAGEVLSSAKNKTKAIGRIIKGPSMADSKMKREEVEQLDEIGDTKEGRKALSSYVQKALHDKDRQKGLRKATSRLYKDNYYGKKTNEEVEQLQEYESKGGVFRHTAKLEKGAEYGASDYSKGGEEEKEAKKMTSSPKRASKGYGARQNFVRSTRVNEKKKVNEELSFTEMLELYNEHGLKVLAPIEVEEVDIDGTTIEVIDADKVNGFVETTVEEVTNDEFTKEYEDQKATFEGKKKQPKVAVGKTTGVKEMPESVELDERTLTKGEAKKKEDYVMGMKKGLSGFKQRYGERAKSVMYATATKMAKKD